MKRNIIIIAFIGITQITFGQNSYDVDIKSENQAVKKTLEEQAKREAFGKCKFTYTFDYKEGDRFIFEKNETAVQYGWDLQYYYLTKEAQKNEFRRTKLLNKDYGGKIIKIIKVEEKEGIVFPDTYITFEVEETGEKISIKTSFSRKYQKGELDKSYNREQIYTLPYLIYLPEIDSFRENFLNKTFYTKFISHGRQYQPVKISKVGAGNYNAPIRLVIENSSGEKENKDVCSCGNNVSKGFIDLNYFENYFTQDDPKKNYTGSEETWDLITQGKIKIGMTDTELILSWGKPKKINETVFSGRASKQYVYYDQYVYVDNGLVTSFQSSK
jgi:hypothetical protein